MGFMRCALSVKPFDQITANDLKRCEAGQPDFIRDEIRCIHCGALMGTISEARAAMERRGIKVVRGVGL